MSLGLGLCRRDDKRTDREGNFEVSVPRRVPDPRAYLALNESVVGVIVDPIAQSIHNRAIGKVGEKAIGRWLGQYARRTMHGIKQRLFHFIRRMTVVKPHPNLLALHVVRPREIQHFSVE